MIPVSRPNITHADIEAVDNCLKMGYVSGDSPIVNDFEERFSKRVNRSHGIAVSNGSVALDLALAASDLNLGDEVIIPSFSIASCLFAVLRTPAKPIFVDVDPETWNISIETLLPAISSRTKILIVVHTYGIAVDLDPILEFCNNRNIKIIEDAAEAHGVSYKDRPCGSFGLMSTFSFYANKTITCGEGGMIVTDDPDLAQRLRSLRNLSFQPPPAPRFIHYEIGWNSRLSSMQAALGTSQLERLSETVEIKRQIGLKYRTLLESQEHLTMQTDKTDYSKNQYWVVGVLLPRHTNAHRVSVRMRQRGIDTRPFFYPLHKQPVLSKFGLQPQGELVVSEHLGEQGIYLPSFVGICDSEIEESVETLNSSLNEE